MKLDPKFRFIKSEDELHIGMHLHYIGDEHSRSIWKTTTLRVSENPMIIKAFEELKPFGRIVRYTSGGWDKHASAVESYVTPVDKEYADKTQYQTSIESKYRF